MAQIEYKKMRCEYSHTQILAKIKPNPYEVTGTQVLCAASIDLIEYIVERVPISKIPTPGLKDLCYQYLAMVEDGRIRPAL